jgi:phosphocarrier protein
MEEVAIVTRLSALLTYRVIQMQREVEIVNQLGLHARPAAEFVRCVQRFQCDVNIHRGNDCFSGGSILEVLSANLDCGARIVLEAIGSDASEALDSLQKLLLAFREEEGSCAEGKLT